MSFQVAPSAASRSVMFWKVRRNCARKSPMCSVSPLLVDAGRTRDQQDGDIAEIEAQAARKRTRLGVVRKPRSAPRGA